MPASPQHESGRERQLHLQLERAVAEEQAKWCKEEIRVLRMEIAALESDLRAQEQRAEETIRHLRQRLREVGRRSSPAQGEAALRTVTAAAAEVTSQVAAAAEEAARQAGGYVAAAAEQASRRVTAATEAGAREAVRRVEAAAEEAARQLQGQVDDHTHEEAAARRATELPAQQQHQHAQQGKVDEIPFGRVRAWVLHCSIHASHPTPKLTLTSLHRYTQYVRRMLILATGDDFWRRQHMEAILYEVETHDPPLNVDEAVARFWQDLGEGFMDVVWWWARWGVERQCSFEELVIAFNAERQRQRRQRQQQRLADSVEARLEEILQGLEQGL